MCIKLSNENKFSLQMQLKKIFHSDIYIIPVINLNVYVSPFSPSMLSMTSGIPLSLRQLGQ